MDGKKARVKGYEVKITNDNIKEIVNYTVENLLNNEDAMKLFKNYMLATVEMMDETQAKQAKESIEVMFEQFKIAGMSEVMKSISDAMDVVADKINSMFGQAVNATESQQNVIIKINIDL